MQVRARRLIQAALGVFLGAVCLYLAFKKIDFGEFWRTLSSVNLAYLVPILAAEVVFFWLKAIRWAWILRGVRPFTAGQTVPALMIGFMANNLLPAHLGEFVRMYVLAEQYKMRKTTVLSTIALERTLDAIGIAGVLAVTLQFLPVPEDPTVAAWVERARIGGYALGGSCLGLLVLFVLAAWRPAAFIRVATVALFLLPAHPRAKAVQFVTIAVEGFTSLRNIWHLAGIVVLTTVHWAVNAFTLYWTAVSFPLEKPLPLLSGFFLMPALAIAVALPAPPGYVGTTQIVYEVALGVFGVKKETALAAGVYGNIIFYVPITIVGLVFLGRLGLRLRTLTGEAERAAGDDMLDDTPAPPAT